MNRNHQIAVALGVAGVIVACLVWLFAGQASAQPASGGDVLVLEPDAGSTLKPGDVIRGEKESPGIVKVWLDGVNHAVPVTMIGDRQWRYDYPGGLSGDKVLAFAVFKDGIAGDVTKVEFHFEGAFEELSLGPRATDTMPAKARMIFRPIEDVNRDVAAFVSKGVSRVIQASGSFGSGDMDNDGVADGLQGGVGEPGSFLGRVPVSVAVALALVVFGIPAVAFTVRGREVTEAAAQIAATRASVAQAKVGVARASAEAEAKRLALEFDRKVKLEAQKLRAFERLKAKELKAHADAQSGALAQNRTLISAKERLHALRLRELAKLQGKKIDAVRALKAKELDRGSE